MVGVCGFGFQIICLPFGQARRSLSPQIAHVLVVLGRVFDFLLVKRQQCQNQSHIQQAA
jgi:preprotein translocase subunit YajC